MTSLVDAIARHASENSAAPALIGLQGSVTYGELLDLVTKIANFLADRRVPRLARAFLNIREPELRLIATIAAVECGLVPAFASPELLRRDYPCEVTIGARLPMRPDIVSDLVIDESVMTGRLADGRRRVFAERSADEVSYVTEMVDTKGALALIGVSAAAHRASLAQPGTGLQPGDRMMFAMGSISRQGQTAAEQALAAGAAIVAAPNDPVGCLVRLALFEVIDLQTTPFGIGKMVETMERQGLTAPSVKHITLMGPPFDPALLARIVARFDAEVRVAYATAEAGLIASDVVSAASYRRGYVGRLQTGIRVSNGGTADAPAALTAAVAPEVVARPLSRGAAVGLDASAILLPDLGFVEGDALTLAGRTDETIVDGGRTILFDRIQRTVAAMPGVRDVGIVSARPLSKPNDVVVAVVSDRPQDLAGFADRVSAEMGWPQARTRLRFIVVADLPHHPTGAIDRGELLRLFAAARPA